MSGQRIKIALAPGRLPFALEVFDPGKIKKGERGIVIPWDRLKVRRRVLLEVDDTSALDVRVVSSSLRGDAEPWVAPYQVTRCERDAAHKSDRWIVRPVDASSYFPYVAAVWLLAVGMAYLLFDWLSGNRLSDFVFAILRQGFSILCEIWAWIVKIKDGAAAWIEYGQWHYLVAIAVISAVSGFIYRRLAFAGNNGEAGHDQDSRFVALASSFMIIALPFIMLVVSFVASLEFPSSLFSWRALAWSVPVLEFILWPVWGAAFSLAGIVALTLLMFPGARGTIWLLLGAAWSRIRQ